MSEIRKKLREVRKLCISEATRCISDAFYGCCPTSCEVFKWAFSFESKYVHSVVNGRGVDPMCIMARIGGPAICGGEYVIERHHGVPHGMRGDFNSEMRAIEDIGLLFGDCMFYYISLDGLEQLLEEEELLSCTSTTAKKKEFSL